MKYSFVVEGDDLQMLRMFRQAILTHDLFALAKCPMQINHIGESK